MKTPAVTVLILNWNGRDDTLECLKSLETVDYTNIHILLVDNGSVDDTAQIVRQTYTDVQIVETGRNLGFAGGNNVGVKTALAQGAEFILLLNNDTVVHPDFLSQMIDAMHDRPDIGASNPIICYYDRPDIIWSAGGYVDKKTGIAYQLHLNKNYNGQIDDITEVDYGTGAALMIRREAFEAVGLLDEAFFLYYEESDWCARAKASGYKTMLVPKARILHKVSRAFDGRSALQHYYLTRNRLYYLKKRGISRSALLRITISLIRIATVMRIRNDSKSARAVLKGVSDFWKGRMGEKKL